MQEKCPVHFFDAANFETVHCTADSSECCVCVLEMANDTVIGFSFVCEHTRTDTNQLFSSRYNAIDIIPMLIKILGHFL